MNNKLNLGCGMKKIEGYLNCDISKEVEPDKLVDLENKLPFKDNSIRGVVGNHILEHITNFILLMRELHRICKGGAILKFKVPFYLSVGAFSDPTHVRFFTPFTFHDLVNKEFEHEFKLGDMFKINKVKIMYAFQNKKIVNFFINPIINLSHRCYCKFFAGIFPAAEIEFELEVVK